MIGVVLAGGTGSRLLPLTKVLNKHLLPVRGQPMLHWPLRTLAQLGVDRAVVVLGGRSCGDVVEHFGSRYDTGEGSLDLCYVYQKGAGGIPAALACALPLLEATGADRAVVVLGDNVFPSLPEALREALSEPGRNASCVAKRVADASSYGCVAVDADGSADLGAARSPDRPSIVEKPTGPPPPDRTWAAVLGFYVLPVWNLRTAMGRIQASARGELEIVDVLLQYRSVYALTAHVTDAAWIDAGDPAGYALANDPAFWP